MGKHDRQEVKLEAVRIFQEGKTHGEMTAALGIRTYRAKGAEAFQKTGKKGLVGRPLKKENTKAYYARLEMEVALLKNSIPNCENRSSRRAISVDLPAPNRRGSESHV